MKVVGGVLTYTAAPGKRNNVTFSETGRDRHGRRAAPTDEDPLSLGPGVHRNRRERRTCPGVTSASIDAGDLADRITAAVDDQGNRLSA